MKKLIYLLLSLMLVLPNIVKADSFDDYNEYNLQCTYMTVNNAKSVTSTASTITFAHDTKAFYIENTGSVTVYYNPSGTAVATATGGDSLAAGEKRYWSAFKTRTISVITASSTSTVKVVGCY